MQSPETQWQKANVLLEFGEWLYRHNFSKSSAQQQVQWAIDIVLQQEPETREAAGTTDWVLKNVQVWSTVTFESSSVVFSNFHSFFDTLHILYILLQQK